MMMAMMTDGSGNGNDNGNNNNNNNKYEKYNNNDVCSSKHTLRISYI